MFSSRESARGWSFFSSLFFCSRSEFPPDVLSLLSTRIQRRSSPKSTCLLCRFRKINVEMFGYDEWMLRYFKKNITFVHRELPKAK